MKRKKSEDLNDNEDGTVSLNERVGVRVLLQTPEELVQNPYCPHGPMLLFEQCDQAEERFFACSAFRDQKSCSARVKVSDARTLVQKQHLYTKGSKQKLREYEIIKGTVSASPPSDRCYCQTCQVLFIRTKNSGHESHDIVENVGDPVLARPSSLLAQFSTAKKEAQYHFSEATLKTFLSFFEDVGVTHVLCVGVPTIFEALQEKSNIESLLLDLDFRFRQFYPSDKYLAYNMFNHHFFEGQSALSTFNRFLSAEDRKKKWALIMDPPFGGKTEVLAHTINIISSFCSGSDLAVFWVFPYFMEKQIKTTLPDFHMLDYKVNYVNHRSFQEGSKGRKQGSPVRIFTNVAPRLLKLPTEEGYKYCDLCEKYVSPENRHCKLCKACTSKDGRTYVHCSTCKRCVKPTYVHCAQCQRCFLPQHPCRGSPYPSDVVVKKPRRGHTDQKASGKWTITAI